MRLPFDQPAVKAIPLHRQSRLESAIEAVVNVAVGYGVAIASQLLVFPIFDIHVSLSANFAIGAWFTGISLARSYLIRRFFNGLKFGVRK